jgi:hypothetical protein
MQTAELLAFPVPKHNRTDEQRRGCVGIHYVANGLALPKNNTGKTIVATITDLIRDHGFPFPNPRHYAGRLLIGAASMSIQSNWPQSAVDAWLEGWRNPLYHATPATRTATSVDALIAARLEGTA